MLSARRREWGIAGLICLAAAAVLLLLCSQSSPLYPLNIWDDANCLLTVGRVMRSGGVLYRDIYEQKGPTLYLMHALAARISDTSFFGVYVVEVLSLAAALLLAYRLLRRRASMGLALSGAAVFGACALVGAAFSRGDSAEELCLPYLMGALTLVFAEYGQREGPMRPSRLFVCGLLAGVVATIKYTILGLFVGLCLCEGALALSRGGLPRALRSAGVFLAGMLLPVLAWTAYFAANGALADAYTAYIYNNIFLYSDSYTLLELAKGMAVAFRDNLTWAVPAAAGVGLFCLRREEPLRLRMAVLAMAACSFVVVFFLGRTWPYCPLVLSVFAAVGVLELLRLIQPGLERCAPRARCRTAIICVASGALSLAMAWGMSPNAYLRGVPLGELAQARLAAYIEPGATLLQYSHLDDGLYLTAGTLPQQKYFVRLNVAYDEMREELDRYLEEAIPDYVFVSWSELPERFNRYQLIAVDAGYDEQNRINKGFYLYRRKNE